MGRRAKSPPDPGADKGYDTFDYIERMRELAVMAHVTQNLTWPGGSAIDGRTTRHDGYAMSQQRSAANRARIRLVENHRVAYAED